MKLDHVVLLTRQFEAMTAAFEQMGFLLTPVGEHGPDAGTANRCITFADHYVEILGVRTDTPMNAPLRALLEHGPAVNMVALLSHDIAATFGSSAASQLSRRSTYPATWPLAAKSNHRWWS
jgi:hypothetical protein